MVRVIYRWQVPPENFDEFKRTWTQTTNGIHESVSGALGSFMLRSHEDETEVLTIARWKTLESWEAFWGNQNPSQMKGMGALGKRVSVQVMEEIDDFTRY